MSHNVSTRSRTICSNSARTASNWPAASAKAPASRRTPKRSAFSGALAVGGSSWTAAVLCRFSSSRFRVTRKLLEASAAESMPRSRNFISVSSGQASVTMNPARRRASTNVAQPSVV